MECVNPATLEFIPSPAQHDVREIQSRLGLSESAFASWRKGTVQERAELVGALGRTLRENMHDIARIMVDEMGKPVTSAEAEIEKCAGLCSFFSQSGLAMLQEQLIPTEASRSYVRFDPVGGILSIMPWNFPWWQVFRAGIPTILVGNVVLLKHAPNVWNSAMLIESMFDKAGFPQGVLTNFLVETDVAGALIDYPHVQGVTLTGSERAGRIVAERAGKACKKCVLELGGSDPFIVLGDADILSAAKNAAMSRCINSGQSCIAAKRFIVERGAYDTFVEAFTIAMTAMKTGDPKDRATQIGPIARLDLLEQLERQVQRSVALGARVRCGGARLGKFGYSYKPTVLTDVTPTMPVWAEETFGPVAAVVCASDVEHAIELANQTRYGLGASVWTKNIAAAEEIARRIDAGNVFINSQVKSDARLPFGGMKASGFGRELSELGLYEFANVKTVWINAG